MTCDDTVLSLGVYLVGALDAADREAVEAHLADCPACQAELAELASLPSMLERLSIDDFPLEPLAAPEDLFDRVAAKARDEHLQQTRRTAHRYRRLTAVAAAVVVIAGASIGASVALNHHSRPANGFSATQGPVTMRVTLASQTTGTGLKVTVSGLPHDEHCTLIAVAKNGSRDVAGRWDVTYAGWGQETGSTKITQSQLSRLVLLGTTGQQLVTVNV